MEGNCGSFFLGKKRWVLYASTAPQVTCSLREISKAVIFYFGEAVGVK